MHEDRAPAPGSIWYLLASLLQTASLMPAWGITKAGEQISPHLYLPVTAANLDTFVLASQFAGTRPRFPANHELEQLKHFTANSCFLREDEGGRQ